MNNIQQDIKNLKKQLLQFEKEPVERNIDLRRLDLDDSGNDKRDIIWKERYPLYNLPTYE